MNRWPVPVPGGNDLSQRLDRRGGNWSYVSLSFAWHTPQFFSRLSQHPPVSFCVSPEVAGAGWARIYDTNATAGDRECFGDLSEALDRLNFDRFRHRSPCVEKDSPEWRDIQAEVLIHDRVPLDFVEQIVVDSRIPLAVERVFGARFPIAVVNFTQWWHGTLPVPGRFPARFGEPPPDP